MATYKTELFGHCVYSPELSYEELISREEELRARIQAALTDQGAEFLQFEALGDTLRVQCVFAEGDEDTCQAICAALAPSIQKGISARLVLVDKDLETLLFYTLSNGAWQEASMQLPTPGSLNKAALPVTVEDVPLPRTSARKTAQAEQTGHKPAGKRKKIAR